MERKDERTGGHPAAGAEVGSFGVSDIASRAEATGASGAFVRAVAAVSTAFGVFSVLLLLVSVAVVVHLVVLRYVLVESAIWHHEFVTYGLIAATFLGSPYVLLTYGHVNVDLLPHYLPMGARRWLAVLASALGLLFCAYITWQGWFFFHEAWEDGRTAGTVWNPPLWVPYLTLPLGMGLVCLQYVAQIIALIRGIEPPFGIRETAGSGT